MTPEILGSWMVVFLTLCIFSYLYDDNPFYKAAEHIFIGVSAGYWAVIAFWQNIQPNLFGRLWPKLDGESERTLFESIWYSLYKILNFITLEITPATNNGTCQWPSSNFIKTKYRVL